MKREGEYDIYYREHRKNVSSFDDNDFIGYVNKNKTKNCVLDAVEQYDAKMGKIFIRLDPELKSRFQLYCKQNNISMNSEIISLIQADLESS